MIPINMNIFVTYKRCLCLNSQSKGRRAARGSDILRGDAKEYSGRRLRLWRVCLPCNKDSRCDRREIREERNREHVGQQKGAEQKGIGVRGNNGM